MENNAYVARLKEHYRKNVVPEMMSRCGYKNHNAVPRIQKVVLNTGVSEAKEDIKALDVALSELSAISGQKPKICRAKKSIANFKIRAGMPIGLMVTLRGNVMYEFLDRLINISIPRIRDFRGLDNDAFDGNGNYNIGLLEQHIFPEIDLEKSSKVRGLNISIVTNAGDDKPARELLSLVGIPFKKSK